MRSNLTSVANRLVLVAFLLLPFHAFLQEDELLNLDDSSLTIEGDTTLSTEEKTLQPPFEDYYPALSSSEVQRIKDNWNTSRSNPDVESVYNPRPINDSRISDEYNFLQEAAKDSLDRWIQITEEETGFEIAVVMLQSIDNQDPHFFATDLFNYWGIGEEGADNGLLVMVVNDIHKVSTITGRGTEQYITDAQTSEIHEEEMIPFFKEDDYTTGVVRGVQVYIEMLYGIEPNYLQTNYDSSYDNDYSYTDESYEYASTPWYERKFIKLYLLLIVLFTAIYLIVLLISFFIKDLHKRYHVLKFFTLGVWPIIMPIPFLPLYFLNKSFMNKWRNTERFSPNTGEFMVKLSESEDNEHLSKGQIKEEYLKSIDYDVWVTQSGDKEEVLILKYALWFSKYRKCPKCRHKTYNKDYDRVISSATYSSSGTGERKYSCKSCGHSKITRYTIPKKTRSSSSSGYSSSSSSWGGSSGGGSSWGGGSSRGGGSTSGW